MNFFYFLTVAMVVSSASNGEIYQKGSDNNFNPSNFTASAYPQFVPMPIRLAITTVLILMLMASYCLKTLLLEEHLGYMIDVTAVKMLIYHSVAVSLAFWFASDQWEFGILLSYGCLIAIGNYYIQSLQMYVRICLLLHRIFHFLDFPINFVVRMLFRGIFVICKIVIIGIHFLLSYMTVVSVYKENFSAFIPLAILLAIGYVGANRISNLIGESLFNAATAYLMLFVNVKLLATLNFALNEGKLIWPLAITLFKAVLIIFAIRSISTAHICRWSGIHYAIDAHISYLLPLAFQLSFNCILAYLISVIYSFYTH